jgi:hypothetical protein
MPTCSPCATVRSECVHSPSASQHSDTLAGHACIHHCHTDLHVLRWGVGQAQSDWAECTAHAPHKLIINLGAEFFFETSTSFNLTQTSRRLKLHQAVRHVLKGNTFCCLRVCTKPVVPWYPFGQACVTDHGITASFASAVPNGSNRPACTRCTCWNHNTTLPIQCAVRLIAAGSFRRWVGRVYTSMPKAPTHRTPSHCVASPPV